MQIKQLPAAVVIAVSMLVFVSCEIDPDPGVSAGYLSACRGADAPIAGVQRFNVSMLVAPGGDNPCVLRDGGGRRGRRRREDLLPLPKSEGKSRRKRAWIFPGTLWCGTGSKAIGYEELGMFEGADRCCREHDHCTHIIPAFTVNYGVFNPNFFTVSHCDCDQRFRECLLGVNDTISSMVGLSFFNIVRAPCFELTQRRQCMVMYWWGMCKATKEAPYAVFQKPFPYKSTHPTSDKNKSTAVDGRYESPSINPKRKSPKGKNSKASVSTQGCEPSHPPRGDTFQGKKRKGKACHNSRKTQSKQTTSPIRKTAQLTLKVKPTLRNVSKISTVASGRSKKSGGRMAATAYPTNASIVASREITKPTRSTRQSTPGITQTAAFKPQAKTKKVNEERRRCRPGTPARGDTFQPRRKPCSERKPTPRATAVTALTAAATSPRQVAPAQTRRPGGTEPAGEEETSTRLLGTTTTTTATPITVDIKVGFQAQSIVSLSGNSPNHTYGGSNKTSQEPTNIGNLLLCDILKILDECKYKIPALEKKYALQNTESKTVYHCDCTSRLAAQVEHVKMPDVIHALLMGFVSQHCLDLSKGRKCHKQRSCAARFSQASDLFQGLKKTEGKGAAWVQDPGKKRGFPVRLHKRCLRVATPGKTAIRLRSKADKIAHLRFNGR